MSGKRDVGSSLSASSGGGARGLSMFIVIISTLALLMGTSGSAISLAAQNASRRSSWWVRPTYQCKGVRIRQGARIQAKINAHPEGTTFCINKGVYRLRAPLIAKNGDRFIGQGRVVLSGARILRSFTRSGSYWLATGQTQESAPVGECAGAYTGCRYNEDVYMDNVPLRQVTDLSQLGPRKFFFDYAADTIYLADNPAGHRVEATIAPRSFWAVPSRVQVKGLVIEKFSNPAQESCTGGSRSGLFAGNEVRYCHGIGVVAYDHQIIKNNWIHDMGQLGVSAPFSTGAVVEDNEISHNNTMGFDGSWESGGSKFSSTTRLSVRGNYVHDNIGSGLWTDIDNISTLYERNIVVRNLGEGIVHEISYDAVIRNNHIRHNGAPGAGWGAGILVAASPNVTIRGNVLNGNKAGILLLAQDRGNGSFGPYVLKNNHVIHNIVRRPKTNGLLLDFVSDLSYYTSRGNRFQYNTYYLGATPRPFHWMNEYIGRKRWVSYGQDTEGRFIRR
jgi:parallel beta-helix repeat protein